MKNVLIPLILTIISISSLSQEKKDRVIILTSSEKNITKKNDDLIFKFPSKGMFRYSKKRHLKKGVNLSMIFEKTIDINEYRKNVKTHYKNDKVISLYEKFPFVLYIYIYSR